jgi:hypothetical protein
MSISSINGVSGTVSRYRYVSSGGETSVSGTDANGLTINYLAGKEEVYLNGVLLVRGQDYTANDGLTISALTALVSGDTMEIITFAPYSIPTAISSATVTTVGDILVANGASSVTRLAVGTNGQYLQADSSQTTGLKWATLSVSPVFPATATSSNISVVSGNSYMVDTTAARTLTLPASASIGNEIHIFDSTGNAATNNITVSNNGLNINGQNTTLTIDKAYAAVNLVYVGSAYGWRVS